MMKPQTRANLLRDLIEHLQESQRIYRTFREESGGFIERQDWQIDLESIDRALRFALIERDRV